MIRLRFARMTGLLLLVAAAGLVFPLGQGCKDREKPVPHIVVVPTGPAEFGTPQALDLPPTSPTGAVTFDPSRYAAISPGGDAMAVYLAEDSPGGTVRLYVVRYDHSLNPIVRYFTAPQFIDANSGNVLDAKVLLDSAGDGLVLWTQLFGGMPRLFASVYQASSESFTPPRLIDAGGDNTTADGVNGFDAAIDTAGGAVIGFYENIASPGVCEAFGVHYYKGNLHGSTGPGFTAPERVSRFSTVSGHAIDRLTALAGPPGKGYVMIRQDADPGPGAALHCSVSRFSSESSLSSFNAVTRVNPPGYNDDVLDFTGAILADGDGLFVFEQNDPSSGYRRIWSRTFDFQTRVFNSVADMDDLAPQSPGLDFTAPQLHLRPDNVAVALFRTMGTTATLHANVYNPANNSFDTSHSTVVSPAGGPVGSMRFAFHSSSSGEVAFTQAVNATGSPAHLFATRFDGASLTFLGGARPCGLGTVETGSLSSFPMTCSDPVLSGVGFDGDGRFLVAFTASDGLLRRLFVNRGSVSDLASFEGARPVDGAASSPVFSAGQNTKQVLSGEATLILDASGKGGVALWRHEEFNGTNTLVRLHGNAYHGFNNPAGPNLTGAQLVDEHVVATANRPVRLFDGAATATGAVVAVVQESGGTEELYIRAYDGKGNHFDLPGSVSRDNGTPETIDAVHAVPGSGDDATVYFLQDDGSGKVHLYGRRYKGTDRSVESLRGTLALSNMGPTFGSVTDVAASSRGGRAFVVFRQVEGAEHGLFALRVDSDGTVTGPARLSTSGATQVSASVLETSNQSRVLVLFREGTDLKARVVSTSSFGLAPAGTPDTVATGATVGAIDAATDGHGNFLVAFESGTPGAGVTILFRRYYHLNAAWEAGPNQVSALGSATVDYVKPVIEAAGNGQTLILYQADDSGVGDLSFLAVTYDSRQVPLFSTASPVDTDGLNLNGLDVARASIAVEPQTGKGFIVFTQDVDPTATVRNRLFVRGFDLARIGSANPVYDVGAVDMSVGGPSAQTEVTLFENALGPYGRGFLVHAERLPAGPNDTVTHLFARPFDTSALFTFGTAELASRSLNIGAGTLGGEGVDGTKILLGPSGDAFMLHTVSQTDTGLPATYRRLFANVYR